MPKKKQHRERPVASTFQIVEAYKTTRTNLMFALATSHSKTVVISSAEPNAGKSTAAANLAITMAQTGVKVLLIDADMRRPSLHRTFRVKKDNGLSMLLSGFSKYEDCVYHEVAKGLDFIPSGSLPPNPSELMGSDAMKQLIRDMEQIYDYVFIDTAPIGVVADALSIPKDVAGTVLVARQRQTTYEELREAVVSVKNVNHNLLGLIITDVNSAERARSYYGKYKYYKGYDYTYSSTDPAN